MGVAQVPHGKTSSWPRCRWCHDEIKPVTFTRGRADDGPPLLLQEWRHVATEAAQCKGRTNNAEPMPALQEEPFIAAVYEFVDKHRKLRRSFREVSQSRASALRRLNDYHELVDKLIDAYDGRANPVGEQVNEAIVALREYRKSTQAAGWR